MRDALVFFVLLGLVAPLGAQPPHPDLRDFVSQPGSWVPFQSIVERNGVAIGRFARDANGSTRLELDVPDLEGRTVVIHNVPQAKYYVYRPAIGWTAQPMVLPTSGYRPLPVLRIDAGLAVSEQVDGLPVFERTQAGSRERRAPYLNFFPVFRESLDSLLVEAHRSIRIGDVEAAFVPPAGAHVTEIQEPAGIVALPVGSGGAQ